MHKPLLKKINSEHINPLILWVSSVLRHKRHSCIYLRMENFSKWNSGNKQIPVHWFVVPVAFFSLFTYRTLLTFIFFYLLEHCEQWDKRSTQTDFRSPTLSSDQQLSYECWLQPQPCTRSGTARSLEQWMLSKKLLAMTLLWFPEFLSEQRTFPTLLTVPLCLQHCLSVIPP